MTFEGCSEFRDYLEVGGNEVIRIFFRKLEGSIGFSSLRNPRLTCDGCDLSILLEGQSIVYPLCSIREIRWEEK